MPLGHAVCSPQSLTLSPCPVTDSNPVPCSFPPQFISPLHLSPWVSPCPSMSFYTPCRTCLPFPSVFSDPVQCVLPCFSGSSGGVPRVLLPSLFLFFPFLCRVDEPTDGLMPRVHGHCWVSATLGLVRRTLSVLGLRLMTLFASLLQGPVWAAAVLSPRFPGSRKHAGAQA